MTNEHEAHRKIVRERVKMVLDEPFFGSLVLRLKIKSDQTCDHVWTDGVTLGYNPDFVVGLTGGQVRGLIAKCVLKCANGHPWRGGERSKETWQEASEVAVEKPLMSVVNCDPMLQRNYGDKYDGKSAESIYNALREEQREEEEEQQQQQQQSPPPPPPPPPPQGGGGEGEPTSAAGEVRDAPAGSKDSEGNPTDEEGEWRMAVSEAAKNEAKSMGNMPAWMKRMYDEAVTSKVNWRAELIDFVQEKSKNDYSWTMPNRRFIAQGLYMPSLYDEDVGEIVFAIDTSGSVSARELGQAAKEINSVVDTVHPSKIHVVYCDSRVAHVDTFEKGDSIHVQMHGGGGTRFDPVFKWIEENDIHPVCTIYLTDMYAPQLSEEPNHPTLWLSTTQGMVSKYGKTVFIDIND